ncbi:lycopene beta-cyclase [Psychrobacter sp. PL19]|uniref:lycopene cyclase family protein n=1 Tax=Psychrobacter sp. PL19 TaxID=2760711 RepID=UPI001AE7CB83
MNTIKAKQAAIDVVIIGAGAAGLSLLLALDEHNYTGTVKVLERRSGPQNDRIWSFWHSNAVPSYIESIVSHKWSTWSLMTQQGHYLMGHSFYQYCSVRSEHLSALAVERTSAQANIDVLFNCDVASIKAEDDGFIITTSSETLMAKQIIDTRPPALNSNHKGLLQCFYGEEIMLDAAIFEPSTVKLMDQLCRSALGIEFVYILPFSVNHALVEFTCFSIDIIDKETLKKRFAQIIKNIVKQHDYKVVRTEHAVLPMYLINQNRHEPHSDLIYGGIAGGAMRTATGYSFLSSQRWAKKCASALTQRTKLNAAALAPINSLYQKMDVIMLRVLRTDMKTGVTIFERMFERVKAERFARFMTEQATLLDILSVIWAMPKWAFLCAAFGSFFTRTASSNKKRER